MDSMESYSNDDDLIAYSTVFKSKGLCTFFKIHLIWCSLHIHLKLYEIVQEKQRNAVSLLSSGEWRD